MSVQLHVRSDYSVIQLREHFRYADRREFKSAVDKAMEEGCCRLIVDLSEVNFIDNSALSILAMTAQTFKREHRPFGLLKPRESVLKLLTISGIHKLIPILQSEKDILAAQAA